MAIPVKGRQFLAFVVASAVAAAVNFGSRLLFSMALPYYAAVTLAFCCGVLTAWVINRTRVFHAGDQRAVPQLARFVLVNLIGLPQTLGVALLLRDVVFPRLGFVWHPDAVAHLVGIAAPVVTSFLLHKHFTFTSRTPRESTVHV